MNEKVDISTFDNHWYKVGKGKFIMIMWFITNVLFFQNPLQPISKIRIFLLRLFGAKVGNNCNIKPNVNIKYPWKLTIGDNVWIGEKSWIDNLGEVFIGDNACISQGAMLLCGNHDYTSSSFDLIVGDITLEEGVWIGAFAVVCPGVICKSHSLLSVNSVATKNLEPYTIYQGNPAKPVRERIIQ